MAAAAAGVYAPVAALVNAHVPEPYMDEIFHIPQAQRYCQLDFHSWDPKITTFPGLYIFAASCVRLLQPLLAVLQPPSSAGGVGPCSVSSLRATNIVAAFYCIRLFIKIRRALHPSEGVAFPGMVALGLALYPLHFFYTFLFYTDVVSTTAVCSMHLATLRGRHLRAALIGAFAVLCRQTNVVWLMFSVAVGMLEVLEQETGRLYVRSSHYASMLKTRKGAEVEQPEGIIEQLQYALADAWHYRLKLLKHFWPSISVVTMFAAFVKGNGGIVVGDRSAHRPALHFAQPLYCFLFISIMMAPLHWSPARLGTLLSFLRQRLKWSPRMFVSKFLITVIAVWAMVYWGSLVHPYLLADNRHYTFYVWKDIFRKHWAVKYALIPAYIYSFWSILHELRQTVSELWVLLFLIVTGTALVPALMLEFRYYTIPFLFAALHTRRPLHNLPVTLTMLMFMALNTVVLRLFLYHPYEWSHEPGIQRFMW
eukprot:jgi/Chlat1/195/Chrsp1S03262